MKYLGAYLLAQLGGNASPSSQDLLKIIGSVGQDVDMEEAKKVIDALSGKSVADLIAEGKTKISSVPSGGGGGATAAVAVPAAAAKEAAPAKKEEPKEESDEDMGFGLFD